MDKIYEAVASVLVQYLGVRGAIAAVVFVAVLGLFGFAWAFIVARKNNHQGGVSGEDYLGMEASLSTSVCAQVRAVQNERRKE